MFAQNDYNFACRICVLQAHAKFYYTDKLEAHLHYSLLHRSQYSCHGYYNYIDTSLLHIPSLEADFCVGTEAVLSGAPALGQYVVATRFATAFMPICWRPDTIFSQQASVSFCSHA